jgi:Tfp pilus assembly protein PilF
MRGYAVLGQGRIEEAKKELRMSHDLDPAYLHPLFALAEIDLETGDIAAARAVLEELDKANAKTAYPRNADLAELAAKIEKRAKDTKGKDVQR